MITVVAAISAMSTGIPIVPSPNRNLVIITGFILFVVYSILYAGPGKLSTGAALVPQFPCTGG